MKMQFLLCLLLVCFSCSPTLLGQEDEDLQIRPLDIVELVNGNRFEGRILSERPDGILLEMAGGTATFLRSDIARVLHRNPPEKIYELKVARSLDPESYESQVELGKWCLGPDVNLLELAVGHLEDAIRIDPRNPAPYELLFPIYDARETNEISDEAREKLLLAECDTLLSGVRSSVSIEGIEKRAVTALKQVGHVPTRIVVVNPFTTVLAGFTKGFRIIPVGVE